MADVKAVEAKAVNPKKEARKAQKNSALVILKELCDKQTDAKYKGALAAIRPSLYGGIVRTSGGTSFAKFVNFVAVKNSVSEDEIFKSMKLGRKDCAGMLRKHLKKSAPADRVWISFSPESGIYKVEGKGAVPPKAYAGFIPTDENTLLK